MAQHDQEENESGLSPDASTLEFAWGLAEAWNLTANTIKKSLTRARTATLVLLVAGACAGAIGAASASSGNNQPGWAVVAALSLGFAGMLETFVVTPTKTRQWTAARMASERLVAAVWTYLTATAPYDGTDAEKAAALRLTIRAVETQTKGVNRPIAPIARPLPEPGEGGIAALYRTDRAQDQLDYHRVKGASEEKKGDLFRGVVLFLTAAGAALVALSSIEDLFNTSLGAWVAMLTTATAAVTTHSRASRFHEVAAGYDRTCVSLELEMHRFSQEADKEAGLPTFVANIESVLAHQNNTWAETVDG